MVAGEIVYEIFKRIQQDENHRFGAGRRLKRKMQEDYTSIMRRSYKIILQKFSPHCRFLVIKMRKLRLATCVPRRNSKDKKVYDSSNLENLCEPRVRYLYSLSNSIAVHKTRASCYLRKLVFMRMIALCLLRRDSFTSLVITRYCMKHT